MEPQIGMGVTWTIGCDSYSFTIVEIGLKSNYFVMQQDNLDKTGLVANPNGELKMVKLVQKGRLEGFWKTLDQTGTITLDERIYYLSPDF
jgi:hypothetical protein